jgi:hypothetical protein
MLVIKSARDHCEDLQPFRRRDPPPVFSVTLNITELLITFGLSAIVFFAAELKKLVDINYIRK